MPNEIANAARYATLPRFPVPALKQTLTRFLAVAKPIVSEPEFEKTVKLTQEFSTPGGTGEKLQRLLESHAATKENWLADWWLNKGYLELRCPLPINISPGLLFPHQDFEGIDGQIKFSSELSEALLLYREKIRNNQLPTDMAGGEPMDMSQYDLLFGTCRLPGEQADVLRFDDKASPAHHIAVAYRNQYYEVPVYDANGRILNAEQLIGQLKQVVAIAPKTDIDPELSLGVFTAQDRTSWARARGKLRSDPANKASLDSIESSLFLICLDQPVPYEEGKNRRNTLGEQVLHGGGSTISSANRWFDKTLQFVVGPNGNCGISYEHSPAEGPPVAGLMDFALDLISGKGKPITVPKAGGAISPAKKLEFNFSDDMKKEIKAAGQKLDKVLSDVEIDIFAFEHYGKNIPKHHKISPDSYFQLALQLAFNRMHHFSPPTYETGTLRRFYLGRTDTIRLPLVESDAFVTEMLNPASTPSRRAQSLRQAVNAHKEYTIATCMGSGIDRHLLGLKIIAEENKIELPDLLASKAYLTALHFKLSTSQVPSKHDACMIFGAMYPDCYGVCYNPQEACINIGLSAYKSCPDTDLLKFKDALNDSLLEMRDALDAAPQAKL